MGLLLQRASPQSPSIGMVWRDDLCSQIVMIYFTKEELQCKRYLGAVS